MEVTLSRLGSLRAYPFRHCRKHTEYGQAGVRRTDDILGGSSALHGPVARPLSSAMCRRAQGCGQRTFHQCPRTFSPQGVREFKRNTDETRASHEAPARGGCGRPRIALASVRAPDHSSEGIRTALRGVTLHVQQSARQHGGGPSHTRTDIDALS